MDAQGNSPRADPSPKNQGELRLLEDSGISSAGMQIFEDETPPPAASGGGKPPRNPPLVGLGGEDDSDESGFGEKPPEDSSEHTAIFEPSMEGSLFGKMFADADGETPSVGEPVPVLVGAGAETAPSSRFTSIALNSSLIATIGALAFALFFVLQSMTIAS